MAKQVCIFLAGMLVGMVLTMVIHLSILDNRRDDRMNKLQPSINSVGLQMMFLAQDLRTLRYPIQDMYNKAGTARRVMQECIDIGRKEVNDYNSALPDGLEVNR